MTKRTLLLVGLVAGAVLLGACSSSSSDESTTTRGAALRPFEPLSLLITTDSYCGVKRVNDNERCGCSSHIYDTACFLDVSS